MNTFAFKCVDCACWQYSNACLCKCRKIGRLRAHQPEWFVIDADDAREPMLPTCPMLGIGIGEFVGRRPNTEIRIASHKRDRRRTELFRVEMDRENREREQAADASLHWKPEVRSGVAKWK